MKREARDTLRQEEIELLTLDADIRYPEEVVLGHSVGCNHVVNLRIHPD